MAELVKGEKSEHVVSRIHWLVRTKTSSHLPKDLNFFFNIFFLRRKSTATSQRIYIEENSRMGGNVEVGQMHCRQKKSL